MRMIPLVALGAVLGGCTPNDVTLGGALRHDLAMQTVDPDPKYSGSEMEGGAGTHAAKAAERYRKGEVKEPVSIKTTSTISGSGSGSSNR